MYFSYLGLEVVISHNNFDAILGLDVIIEVLLSQHL